MSLSVVYFSFPNQYVPVWEWSSDLLSRRGVWVSNGYSERKSRTPKVSLRWLTVKVLDLTEKKKVRVISFLLNLSKRNKEVIFFLNLNVSEKRGFSSRTNG